MTGGGWRVSLGVRLVGVKTPANGTSRAPVRASEGKTQGLTFGMGDGTMSVLVDQSYGLAAGQALTLDLYDGSIPDLYGDKAAFRVLRSYALFIDSGGDTAGVSLAGGAANPHALWWLGTTPGEMVYPGGPGTCNGDAVGKAVTSTARTLKLTNRGTAAVKVRLLLAGSTVRSGTIAGLLGYVYP